MTRTPLTFASSALVLMMILPAAPALAQEEAERPEGRAVPERRPAEDPGEIGSETDVRRAATLWEDFIHYIRVAQVELAISSGRSFLETTLSAEQVLHVVDELSPYRDYLDTLERAQRMDGEIARVARRAEQRVKAARLDTIRQGERIRASVESLGEGLRARLNAQERLQRAGQYAAPELLNVLLSTRARDQELRPYVIDSMVQVGRPIVGPLCEALPHLPSAPKRQVAEVLSRIGYPMALPYLRAEMDREDLDESALRAVRRAFNNITERSGVPRNLDAGRLFLRLAEDYYAADDSLILEPEEPANLLWDFTTGAGLVATEIPTPVYHDVMAMRMTRRALRLSENLSPAMSLWLAANFRRQNNLPSGAEDPSYGPDMRSPHYYATIAGPRHVHPVLWRALDGRDADLALDAIRALSSTSGSESLLAGGGGGESLQPLIAALDYPDQRVRFEAALTIATSRPTARFDGAQRVVPVLAEAIRQGGAIQALVLGSDGRAIDEARSILRSAGDLRVLMGDSLEVAEQQLERAAVVDLVVVAHRSASRAEGAVTAVQRHPKLAAAPVLVFTDEERMADMNRVLRDRPNVTVANLALGESDLTRLAARAIGAARGVQLTADQAERYATAALDALHQMMVGRPGPFRPGDAMPALLGALNDSRESVTLRAAEVLAEFAEQRPQRALADAAVSGERGEDMQIAMLESLARSARLHGNLLSDRQLRELIGLVTNARGALADAASEAHGALNLPTSNAVRLITRN